MKERCDDKRIKTAAVDISTTVSPDNNNIA